MTAKEREAIIKVFANAMDEADGFDAMDKPMKAQMSFYGTIGRLLDDLEKELNACSRKRIRLYMPVLAAGQKG